MPLVTPTVTATGRRRRILYIGAGDPLLDIRGTFALPSTSGGDGGTQSTSEKQ
ncbi:hypothetical protein L195_g020190 [Trifolium pratense]|uniref:Uncharacterized protein n=1 Tax=Trifolium pratense TaxID=57577 RepID=A0A2K3N1S6_TRIPR|nr:hypothetical protein L195_g020190 [Trifolium pratense]